MTVSTPPVIEHQFDSLYEAITFAFRQEQTSLLSLDRICQVLQNPNLYFTSKSQGLVQCSTVTRRRISSALSTSELFVRAGSQRTCLWAIRPHNPLFLSDGAILASIEQMLTENGPMTVDQFVNATQLAGADINLYNRFIREHEHEFSQGEDGTYWFKNQPRPQARDFESISSALVFAFNEFPQGASVEELHWYLCLSTVSHIKKITRRCVSRELSRRTDLFSHLSRARYILLRALQANQEQNPVAMPIQNPAMMPNPGIPILPMKQPSSLPSIPHYVPTGIPMAQPYPMPPTTPNIQVPMPIQEMKIEQPMPSMQMPITEPFSFYEPNNDDDNAHSNIDDDIFDPSNFFGSDFQFSFD